MKDEEFDKLLKEQMKSDTYIPEKIDKLFSDFEKNMEKNIRFCRQEKGEKSLIKIKKDDKMKYKVNCSKYRKI